jgi:ABC-2 type transport system permease protein
LQAYAFLGIAALFGITFSPLGYITALPALALTALMVGALGLALSSTIKQLENFSGVMNFVIFPMFFMSTALYPLWKMSEASTILYQICIWNPFTHGIELIRFALYLKFSVTGLAVSTFATALFMGLALWGYNPTKGLIKRKA